MIKLYANPLVEFDPLDHARRLERTGWMWTVAEKVALLVSVILTAAAFVAMSGLFATPNPLIPLALIGGGLLARQIVAFTTKKQQIFFTWASNERQVVEKQSERSQISVIEARIALAEQTALNQKNKYEQALRLPAGSEENLQKTWHEYQTQGLKATVYQSLLLHLKDDPSLPFTSCLNLGAFESLSYGLYLQTKPHGADVFFKSDGIAALTVTQIEEALARDRIKDLLTPFIDAARQRLRPALPQ